MNRLFAPAVLAAASTLAACGLLDPRPDASRFFVLASLEDMGSSIDACALPAGVRVGLGPVHLPEYLERPALLTRTSPTELTPSLTDRWSEPLDTMLPRVLSDDLSQILHSRDVVPFPWYSTERPQWQIEVDVVRFEPDAKGEVLLIAQWRVHELGGDAASGAGASLGERSRSATGVRSKAAESRITEQAESNDAAHRTQAQSAALGALAEELAHAVCSLAAK